MFEGAGVKVVIDPPMRTVIETMLRVMRRQERRTYEACFELADARRELDTAEKGRVEARALVGESSRRMEALVLEAAQLREERDGNRKLYVDASRALRDEVKRLGDALNAMRGECQKERENGEELTRQRTAVLAKCERLEREAMNRATGQA